GRGRNSALIMPFGRSTRPLSPAEHTNKEWHFQYSSREVAHATNLELALREAVGGMPSGLVPRVLLISDGNENQGSVTRAIWQAQQLGIPVDTVSLSGRPKPDLQLEA